MGTGLCIVGSLEVTRTLVIELLGDVAQTCYIVTVPDIQKTPGIIIVFSYTLETLGECPTIQECPDI